MNLAEQHTITAEQGLCALREGELPALLASLKGWQVDGGLLSKTLRFADYYQTSAFVSAVVWLAHQADHHPEICFGYRECRIQLSTHAVDGLSMNDFILAARIDRLQQD